MSKLYQNWNTTTLLTQTLNKTNQQALHPWADHSVKEMASTERAYKRLVPCSGCGKWRTGHSTGGPPSTSGVKALEDTKKKDKSMHDIIQISTYVDLQAFHTLH